MKTTLNGILLGSALLLAPAGVSWAGPSPDLMNSALSMRLEADSVVQAKPATPQAKRECAGCTDVLRTRNITAGQSTVAVPEIAYGSKK